MEHRQHVGELAPLALAVVGGVAGLGLVRRALRVGVVEEEQRGRRQLVVAEPLGARAALGGENLAQPRQPRVDGGRRLGPLVRVPGQRLCELVYKRKM